MSEIDLHIRCQRCGTEMELRDPAPGTPWKPDQFWVCSEVRPTFLVHVSAAEPRETQAGRRCTAVAEPPAS